MNILLIEPEYKTKYPPLGLMKIAQYHKSKGDNVIFKKGLCGDTRDKAWDRIYISTLFTFYWNKTIKTIKYYRKSVKDIRNLIIGGAMATLLADDIRQEIPSITVIKGLLCDSQMIGYNDKVNIDELVPDYDILDTIDYNYKKSDAYITYTTRSCPNKCEFCAVRELEPEFDFNKYISIKKQIEYIIRRYGEKKDLLLLDNNVLASKKFADIIAEIKDLGFKKGTRYNGKLRYVDFNQGLDGRRLTKNKMKFLSEIAIRPLRIAFDDIRYEKTYIKKIRWAAEYDIKMLSNYILFNFNDKPYDFYKRLKINIRLNEEFSNKGLKTKIWSFPMKYVPLKGKWSKNRKYIGKHWNKKYLRGIQCILLATHGVVGPKREFFNKAFGKSYKEFLEILMMPEDYIIHRLKHEQDGSANEWQKKIYELNNDQLKKAISIIKANIHGDVEDLADDRDIISVLKFYENRGIS